MRHGFQASGGATLFGATIKLSCDCSGGEFLKNPKTFALYLSKAKVGANLFMREGFSAIGEVRLHGTTIIGNLECQDGSFLNHGCTAMLADGLSVGGRALLNCQAYGMVSLFRCRIDGELNCTRGRFHGGGQPAISISLDRANIAGNVYLSNDFVAYGEVSLLGATINGNLDCRESRFVNAGLTALDIGGAAIGGSALFGSEFRAEGTVRMTGTTIARDLDCRGAYFFTGSQEHEAIDARRLKVGHDGLFGDGMRTNGLIILGNASLDTLSFSGAEFIGDGKNGVSVRNATITNQFVWQAVKKTENTNLDMAYARIAYLEDDKGSWPAQGNLQLEGLSYMSIAATSPVDWRTHLVWLRRQAHSSFSPQPYDQLAKVLRDSGHEKDAKRVAMEKQDDRRNFGDMSPLGRLGNFFLEVTIGHGYAPGRAFAWGIAIIVAFGLLFYLADNEGLMVPAEDKVFASKPYQTKLVLPDYYPSFHAMLIHSKSFYLPSTCGRRTRGNLATRTTARFMERCYPVA